MRRLLLLIVLLFARGSTNAQTDSIFIESGGVILKKCLVSDIDWITFSRTVYLPPLVGVENDDLLKIFPAEFSLSQNYPNPFNPSTNIKCRIPTTGQVRVRIFDINGNLVKEIFSGEKAQGEHIFTWEGNASSGTQAATGVYLFSVQFNNIQLTKKIIYLK